MLTTLHQRCGNKASTWRVHKIHRAGVHNTLNNCGGTIETIVFTIWLPSETFRSGSRRDGRDDDKTETRIGVREKEK